MSRLRLLALCLFMIALSPQSALAQWNSKAYEFGRRGFGNFPGPSGLSEMSRGTMAAVWGGGLREMKYGDDLVQDEHRIKMPEFFDKKVRVYLRPAYSDPFPGRYEPRRIKAPLLVFIPGIFGDADQAMAQGMMKMFSEMGYHVLLIPNCWSRDYHEALPIERTEYPNDEATAVLALTQWATTVLGSRYVEGAMVAGESLGALTAAVAFQKDAASTNPVFTQGATLMWPPLKLTSSISTLDRMIESTETLYEPKCHSLLKKLKTKFRVWRGKFLTSPTRDEIECAPAVVAHYSFKKELVKLAEKILDARDMKQKVSPIGMDFTNFIERYAHRYRAALKPNDRMGDLGYWIDSTPRAQRSKLRIITSSDDFINAGESWREIASELKSDQILTLSWGGHIGATNHSAFKKLMRYQFKR